MIYDWDEDKRQSNLAKHGLDFADVEGHFDWDGAFEFLPDVLDFETRYRHIGWMQQRLVMLIWTDRKDAIRIISLRPATRGERKIYVEYP